MEVGSAIKIMVFGWRVLHRRIATMDTLKSRGIIALDDAISCVLCCQSDESCDDLFKSCPVTSFVWIERLSSLVGGSGHKRGFLCGSFCSFWCLFQRETVEAPEAIKLAADSTSPRVYAIDVL
jgi:hypothetical protein